MTSSKSNPKPGRVIAGDTLTNELVTWEAPEVKDEQQLSSEETQAQLTALREQVVQQGYAEGHATGLASAEAEVQAQIDALNGALNALARPLEHLDHQVEDELLALVQAVSRQLIRRELRADPGEIINVIREGLAALPVSSQGVTVRLHPEDARLVRELLKPSDDETPWQIQADPVLERGGCQIVTEASQIDGRLETRLGRVIAGLLEEQRTDESDDA